MEPLTSFVSDLVKTLTTGPGEFLLIAAALSAGYFIKMTNFWPNVVVPWITFLIIVGGEPFVGHVEGDYPVFKLIMIGIVLWAATWVLHAQILKRFERFLPAGLLTSDETIPNPKPPPPPP